jgi:hypothetical protein
MTKDDIIHMAREAGFGSALTYHKGELRLERFAELLEAKIRADEREACAALCSEVAAGKDAEAIEEAIRARGEK